MEVGAIGVEETRKEGRMVRCCKLLDGIDHGEGCGGEGVGLAVRERIGRRGGGLCEGVSGC